jgi:hypothetical protein
VFTLLRHPHTQPKESNGQQMTKAPEASKDSVGLKEEIARLQENVDKKDSMLSMLTEGLKEVNTHFTTHNIHQFNFVCLHLCIGVLT